MKLTAEKKRNKLLKVRREREDKQSAECIRKAV
jgi:hypothetical protein